jgi:hypothetical protein
MNPLLWKKDLQLASLCAMILGGVIGTVIGIREVDP